MWRLLLDATCRVPRAAWMTKGRSRLWKPSQSAVDHEAPPTSQWTHADSVWVNHRQTSHSNGVEPRDAIHRERESVAFVPDSSTLTTANTLRHRDGVST
ncbi:hypothetical protein PR003_g27988 [Phytophthora rubi]|uniref:Uncharacterized protein n=1 Tax=Phytophthora rubi TaxID=129364 RepID=A0A6A4BXV5_9STRA|nr:hypothetical protein PF003_g6231 [Phytophthora fragariae]KAE9280352.1 hypothetical protein PR003_g27988 [Phytophthora rubi]